VAEYINQGDTALNLAEECAEVIQIITKMKRFDGDWDEIPPGKEKSRWEMLEEEMADVLSAWSILQEKQRLIREDNALLLKEIQELEDQRIAQWIEEETDRLTRDAD
jgi:hypothetical protein